MITDEDIKQILGRKYDPSSVYSIHDKPGALSKIYHGTHKPVGKIQTNQDGEMIILKELSSTNPKQSIVSKLKEIPR